MVHLKPKHSVSMTSLFIVILATLVTTGKSSIYKMMSEMMGWNDGWESKGITFGIKSKGMTAIIPIPLPIPIFTKEKKGGGKGDSGGGDKGGGGGGGDKGGDGGGGWEPPSNDWW